MSFFMTNLTNDIYPVAINQSYVGSGYEARLYGAPRMFGFRAKYRFGAAAE